VRRTVIIRVWRARVDEARSAEYEHFAERRSAPMFQAHDGYLGVLFARNGESCMVITLWETARAAEALSASPLYQQTVRDIMAAGFLRSEGSVEVFESHGFALPGGSHDVVENS